MLFSSEFSILEKQARAENLMMFIPIRYFRFILLHKNVTYIITDLRTLILRMHAIIQGHAHACALE